MRSRRTKSLRDLERKRRPLGLYLIAGIIVVSLLIFVLYRTAKAVFVIEKIVVRGNHVLSEDEIKRLIGTGYKKNLLELSSSQIYHRLIGSPWIKEAVIRKELPDKLIVWIEEASPQAVIRRDGRLYLIDDTGVILEELRDDSPLLLPLLDVDYENREILLEALLLLREMKAMNISPGETDVVIKGSRKEDLTILLRQKESSQSVQIKIGYGGYKEKLRRLIDFSPAIKERSLRPFIIDLRFNYRVIVREKKDG